MPRTDYSVDAGDEQVEITVRVFGRANGRAAPARDGYNALIAFLLKENPYGRADLEAVIDVQRDGPAQDNRANKPFKQDDRNGVKGKGLAWPFRGQDRNINKALLIPYTFEDPDTGRDVEGALLVGYIGPSGS